VVGLQALSQYEIDTKSRDLSLNFTLVADNWVGKTRQLITENGTVQHIIENVRYILIILIKASLTVWLRSIA
jgi:hypothetical protein